MMVRTYGRRKPGTPRTLSDSMDDVVSQSEYLSSSSSPDTEPREFSAIPFSSQDSSSLWHSSSSRSNFLEDFSQNGVVRRSKRSRNEESCALTSTLMEAQEFGEMMEHMDEVNFALDGLRRGQQLRIRRASLSSLLSICASQHQRRLLRAQGISKSIIDAVLGLSLDDIPSNLAAATLFFVLTADDQDEHFMESHICIKFLIKLLKPVIATSSVGKPRNLGYKLLSLLKDVDAARDTAKMHDPSSSDILCRVQETLVNCKEMRLIDNYKTETMTPELSMKWVALLAMEKACLSKISFDDTSGAVKKTGGKFKEKLRELGGLDAVVEVVMDCHTVMERPVENHNISVRNKKDDVNKHSLILLLKCLKIVENATFLSRENQNHLLGFKKSVGSHGTRLSFTELMISVIKMLSGFQLHRGSSSGHRNSKSSLCSNGINRDSIFGADCGANNEVVTISSDDTCSTVSCSSTRNGGVSQRSQSVVQLDCSGTSMLGSDSINEPCTSRARRAGSTISSSFAGRFKSLASGISRSNGRTSSSLGGEPSCTKSDKFASPEDSEDPFSFDFEDSEPSKWEVLSGKQKKPKAQKRKECHKGIKDEFSHQVTRSPEESKCRFNSQEESSDRDCHISHNASSSNDMDEECLSLLSDCLLTAVKVLMNLTNDNSVGCRQIAACGGLEAMSELIAGHFPLFSRSPLSVETEKMGSNHQKERHLADQELDFLVAILGLLVNLVEKDGMNRSRLATATVSIPNSEGLVESEQEVIPLLCSIFLANQGSGEAKEETPFTLDDEEAVLESEKEAEKMIVEAYSALLLAFLSTESRSTRNVIKDYLPKGNLAILVPVLDRFLAFHTTLKMIPEETHKAVLEVIESCKLP
ncbi:PREDICTED: wings apart-like protein homolog [Tarenaya hassleriana]|uniref:wings apart-like protein homolog n=1 Tax=Tarenaya hassleriana TaxID=28532 RepID=UPI00053C7BC4|nr:PREDICTED: wings apart-like protein homolog [Tarenaya hassleriana]